jgi:hypothetical protein
VTPGILFGAKLIGPEQETQTPVRLTRAGQSRLNTCAEGWLDPFDLRIGPSPDRSRIRQAHYPTSARLNNRRSSRYFFTPLSSQLGTNDRLRRTGAMGAASYASTRGPLRDLFVDLLRYPKTNLSIDPTGESGRPDQAVRGARIGRAYCANR